MLEYAQALKMCFANVRCKTMWHTMNGAHRHVLARDHKKDGAPLMAPTAGGGPKYFRNLKRSRGVLRSYGTWNNSFLFIISKAPQDGSSQCLALKESTTNTTALSLMPSLVVVVELWCDMTPPSLSRIVTQQ